MYPEEEKRPLLACHTRYKSYMYIANLSEFAKKVEICNLDQVR